MVSAVLNRVSGEYACYLKTQRFGLDFRSVHKRGGGHKNPGDASPFKIVDVVHTARGTRTSIGECFNNRMATGGDFVAQVNRSRFGKGGFDVAAHFGPLVTQQCFEMI